ncbi:MAG: hypothetical protein JO101_07865 [Candidatus Eremiobacteraeota bacterium]|nr:hypothetical protein [Candidatus Eremiobacteraeota bacterium]MBV8355219.1 hypothetical protein [Candidatus Eremiobacteraeota bacterium]
MDRFVRIVAALGILAVSLAAAPATQAQGDASALLARMSQVNAKLQSYTASAHVDIAMHSFPFLNPALDGTFYFKQPDKQAVVFDAVPALAKQFQKVYPRLDPPATWSAIYNVTAVGSEGGSTMLRLVPKKHGRVSHLDVKVDNASATPVAYTWTYEDGGTVTFDQSYAQINGNYLVKSESGRIDLPQYKADVTSTFSNFKLNVPISDSVFAS